MIFFPVINPSPIEPNCTSTDKKQNQKKIRIPFRPDEDEILRSLVEEFGDKDWSIIASHMEGRTIRQCRERWQNNLSSNIIKSKWTREEDKILKIKYSEFGPKWKFLEEFFPGRTSYNIRNRWNGLTRIKKKQLNKSKGSTSSMKKKSSLKQKMSNVNLSDANQNNFNVKRSLSTQKIVVPMISNNNDFINNNNCKDNNKDGDEKVGSKYSELKFDKETFDDDFFQESFDTHLFSNEDLMFSFM